MFLLFFLPHHVDEREQCCHRSLGIQDRDHWRLLQKCKPNVLCVPSGYSAHRLDASGQNTLADRAKGRLFWQSTRPLPEIGGYRMQGHRIKT